MVDGPVEQCLDLDAADAFGLAAPGLSAIFYSSRLTAEHRDLLRPHLTQALARPLHRENGDVIGVMVPVGATDDMREVIPEDVVEDVDRPTVPAALKYLLGRR